MIRRCSCGGLVFIEGLAIEHSADPCKVFRSASAQTWKQAEQWLFSTDLAPSTRFLFAIDSYVNCCSILELQARGPS